MGIIYRILKPPAKNIGALWGKYIFQFIIPENFLKIYLSCQDKIHRISLLQKYKLL